MLRCRRSSSVLIGVERLAADMKSHEEAILRRQYRGRSAIKVARRIRMVCKVMGKAGIVAG